MNIVHLVSSKAWGGGERYVLDLARAQRADGHTVQVLTRRCAEVMQPFEAEHLLAGTLRFGGPLDVITPLRLAKRLDALAAGGAQTVVHAHNFKVAQMALTARSLMHTRDARVKVVCTSNTTEGAPDSPGRRRILAGLDGLVFMSDRARDRFVASAPEVDAAKTHTVHSAIVAERFPRDARPGSDRAVRLIFCGRIVPEKGLDVLMRALASLKHLSWTLEVCGSGRSRDVMPVVRLARGLGVDARIDWRGFESAPLARMARADALVLPSTGPETLGLAIIEAFSQGLPVVTTTSGVQAEMMTDGREGFLVPPGDEKALAKALERIIVDGEARRAMAARAAEAFDSRFAYTSFYRTIINVYNA